SATSRSRSNTDSPPLPTIVLSFCPAVTVIASDGGGGGGGGGGILSCVSLKITWFLATLLMYSTISGSSSSSIFLSFSLEIILSSTPGSFSSLISSSNIRRTSGDCSV